MKRTSSFLFLAILMLAGCGYRFSGSGARLPEGIYSISIPIFANQTIQTGIESEVTRALVEKFTSARQLRVTGESEADALLRGTVKSFVTSPSAVTLSTQTATEYRATLTVEVTFKRQRDGKVFWKGEMSEWRNYAVVADLAATEANKQEAIQEASQLLAERLYVILLEEF
jgi:outer membrane lipopolysaccharide assembly protein LptE/RlpB